MECISDFTEVMTVTQAQATAIPYPTISTTGDTTADKFKLPALTITKKFPFCIPFDILRAVKVLSVPRVTPKVALPFKVDSLGLNSEIVIDLKDFEGLASISRWFLSIIFLIGLIMVTRSLIL